MNGSNVSGVYALFGEVASYHELWPAPITVVNVSHQWQSSSKRLCSSGLANATAAKMERYLTGYPGPGIGERYMWFCAADDGPILPEGVPGPITGPTPGTGGPGPIAPPPPPVGAAWKPPLVAISGSRCKCLNVAAGGGTELPREREQSFGCCWRSSSDPYCKL